MLVYQVTVVVVAPAVVSGAASEVVSEVVSGADLAEMSAPLIKTSMPIIQAQTNKWAVASEWMVEVIIVVALAMVVVVMVETIILNLANKLLLATCVYSFE